MMINYYDYGDNVHVVDNTVRRVHDQIREGKVALCHKERSEMKLLCAERKQRDVSC